MVSLFNNDVTQYDGVALKVPPVGMSPKPQTRPHPPFVFGGHAKPALRRAAQRGNGWLASELTPEEMVPLMATIVQMREEAGRTEIPFEMSCAVMGDPSDELIAQYADVGVDRLVVRPWMRGRDAVANLTTLAERIL
jgi:alkanesulfonate monooxygenase SsuD/methylene tetrahydromethanopterin reductase-like flavin-dependent oxidoreductase (luciferase family)